MSENNILELFSNDTLKDKICRLCLKECEIFYNLYETEGENTKSILDMLEVMLAIKIIHQKGYPEIICKECLDKVIVVSEFKMDFIKSNTILEKCYHVFHKNNDDNSIELPLFNFDIHEDENFECGVCQRSFQTSNHIQEHLNTFKHSVQCKICKKMYNSRKKLRKHTDKHKKLNEIVCPFCDGLIKNNCHIDDFKYVCHYCNFKYPCKLFLEKHIVLEHPDGVVCVKTVNNQNITSAVRSDDVYKCNECDRTFKKERFLKLHRAASNCKYVCDYCDVVYKFKDQLKLHIMTKHINYKPYRCDVCHKTFALKTILKSHSVVHTKERKFQCDFCGKSFVCNVTLRYHRRLHTGERPYRCVICGEGFINTSRLRDHEQVKHIGRVQCPTCLRTFTKRSTLKHHMDNLHPNTYVKGNKYMMFDNCEI